MSGRRIELFTREDGTGRRIWFADFVGDAEVRELFGGTVLPTPFFDVVPAADVLERVGALNPECVVVVR